MSARERMARRAGGTRMNGKLWLGIILLALLLPVSAGRMELDHLFDPAAATSQKIVRALLDFQIAERRDISRIENFDPGNLPPFAYLEEGTAKIERVNRETLRVETREVAATWLVEPFGYAQTVVRRLLETVEIALWGTLLALVMGVPLALTSASSSGFPAGIRLASRTLGNFLRAMPELVSALILVAIYGFGPLAGVLALALHSAGFFGKFLADEMENADPAPQRALQAIGAPLPAIVRAAILPEVAPQFISYIVYIIDRNVRMATVVGLVGAGGIGQELKGRLETYDYGHAGTILLAIFLVVLLIDGLGARIRRRLFGEG